MKLTIESTKISIKDESTKDHEEKQRRGRERERGLKKEEMVIKIFVEYELRYSCVTLNSLEIV